MGDLRPDWPAPAHVHALCTTRTGGVSGGAYGGQNLGDHVGDDPAAVLHNRRALQARIGARPVFLRQVHGDLALELDRACAGQPEADASWTRQVGLACTILVADCLPVLLTDTRGQRVAAAHAGWRGLAGHAGIGVLENTVRQMGPASELMAWLGPCIGSRAFEVGEEVRQAFVSSHSDAALHFRATGSPGKYHANLAALAVQRLAALGVTRLYGNLAGQPQWCTVQQNSRFFSHRGSGGRTGRFAACIWRL